MMNNCFQQLPKSGSEKAIPQIEESPLNLMHNNKISTWDKDSSEEETKEKMYDASLESKERTQPQKEIKQYQKLS